MFYLSLERVTDKKVHILKQQSVVGVTEEELNYLMNECKNAFLKGYLKVELVDEKIAETTEIVEPEVEYNEESIRALLTLSQVKIKAQLSKINATHILKDIRIMAEEMGKPVKVIEMIDLRIREVTDSLVI